MFTIQTTTVTLLGFFLIAITASAIGYTSAKSHGLCPPTWHHDSRSGTCVKVFGVVKKSWNDARKTCQQAGGDLVKIINAEMNQFLFELLARDYYWIGLRRRIPERGFRWLDENAETNFTAWNDGDPNESSSPEICTDMEGGPVMGQWHDYDCVYKNYFICERPPASCVVGWYGRTCLKPCSQHCANRLCHRDTGYCSDGCVSGYTGDTCSEACNTGWYGARCSTRCSTNCAGSDNACDHVTGVCDNCPPGKYGFDCSDVCSVNCGGPNNTCGRDSGKCDSCLPGYQGERCDQVCPRRKYGLNCVNSCSDHCAGPDNACSNVDGACDQGCEPGYLPLLCSQKCPIGRYGPQCNQTCSAHCAGLANECDYKTGTCYKGFDMGFQPPTCHDECPAGTFGQNCEWTCSVHCAGSDIDCNKRDGSCDLGCEPGYSGRFCSEICPRGQYGPGCVQNCSDQCAGQERPCHHVDGMCYLGCVQDDQSPMCRGFHALQQKEESEGSGLNVWGIAATIVAVVAAIVMGFLAWRLYQVSKERPSTPANKDIEEEGSPQQAGNPPSSRQQTLSMEDRPNQSYVPVEVDPEDVHVYNEGFDHYDSPLDLMRKSGEYEIPRAVAVSASNQDYVEPSNVPATTSRNAEGAAYVNTTC